MTKFKVGDKVRVISNRNNSINQVGEIGVLTVVTDVDARVHVDGRKNLANWHPFCEIELISEQLPKQTKSQRIAALEAEVQRLHERLSDLERKDSEEVTLDADYHPFTPNEQRKAIITEAKAFVSHWEPICATKVTFEINTEKRTVVALRHRRDNGRVFDRGIAKAHPDDVFNADIGKAIALGRALGLDVTRFEKAVQPTEVVVGMKTFHYHTNGIPLGTRYVNDTFVTDEGICIRDYKHHGKYAHVTFDEGDRIIDDTEAQY